MIKIPTNDDEFVDSRDVRAAIEWLEDSEDDDEQAQRAVLIALAEEGEQYADDWGYGATMVRDSYFETYAREFADDIGAIDSKAAWPLSHIDWEAAANELKQDFTSIDFDGIEYWVR